MIFAMRLYILLGALLLATQFSGCTGMVKERDVATTEITWIRKAPVNCGGEMRDGCAVTRGPACFIYMDEDAPDFIIAHEFRHCFGYKHV
jgi:hypothetical protein